MNELKQKIEKVMSEWEPLKAEYALPNSTVPITDFWTIAYDMAIIIKELTEREAKLVEAFNPRTWTVKMQYAWHTNLPNTQRAFEALKEATLKELGVK